MEHTAYCEPGNHFPQTLSGWN